MSTNTDPWVILSVTFVCRPEHRQVRYEVIHSTVARFSTEVHRPTCREQIEFLADGTWQFKYEVAAIPTVSDLADVVARALTTEGIITEDEAVTVFAG